MCEQLIKQNPDKDTMAIVGASHLKGMLNDEELQKHFHVIALSAIDPLMFDPELESTKGFRLALEEYFVSDYDVKSMSVLPNTEGLYLTLNQYSKLIKNIVESQNNATDERKKFESFGIQTPISDAVNSIVNILLAISGLLVHKALCGKGVGSAEVKVVSRENKAEEIEKAALGKNKNKPRIR